MNRALRRPAIDPASALIAAALVAAAAYSAVAANLDPFTHPMEVAVAVPFVPMLVLAWRRGWHRRHPELPPGSDDPLALAALVPWLVIIALIVVFQMSMFYSEPRTDFPTYSSIASDLFEWWPARAAAFMAWLGLGWYLVER